MENIINVNIDTQTVSARELHKQVGSTERFSSWFERQLQYGFAESEDYTTVKVLTEVQNNGGVQKRELVDYNLSVDMAKQICMVQKTEKAKQVRQYLIDLEKAWNTPEKVMARALKIADKQIKDLKAVNQVLLEDNQRMKPKEIFADAVSASDTSILVRELAKLISQNGVDMGEKKLYKWLEDNGYVIKQKGKDYHKPTQKSMNLKVFEIKERVFVGSNGDSFTKTTPMVTTKGQQYFVNKFLAKE